MHSSVKSLQNKLRHSLKRLHQGLIIHKCPCQTFSSPYQLRWSRGLNVDVRGASRPQRNFIIMIQSPAVATTCTNFNYGKDWRGFIGIWTEIMGLVSNLVIIRQNQIGLKCIKKVNKLNVQSDTASGLREDWPIERGCFRYLNVWLLYMWYVFSQKHT